MASRLETIECEDQVFDFSFHPHADYVATALINGVVSVYRYGVEAQENNLILRNKSHTSSCRGVLFTPDGQYLYSISSDKSIQVLDSTGKQSLHVSNAHSSPLNKIVALEGTSLIATGDDSGVVKVWDLRAQQTEVMSWSKHSDFISCFCYCPEKETLLTASGDSTLCAYDMKMPSQPIQSDEQDSEINCMQVIKGGRKLVCGTQDGVLSIFSWGRWGDCSDRYPGHPQTIDCILPVDESTILTGSSDGLIRVISIQPNKILGVLGNHDDFPVEGLSYTRNRSVVGSYSHDECVRLWDVSIMDEGDEEDGEGEGDEDDSDEDEDEEEMAVETQGKEADVEEEEEEDDDSSVDSIDKRPPKTSSKKESQKEKDSDSDDDEAGGGGGGRSAGIGRKKLPTSRDRFFADL